MNRLTFNTFIFSCWKEFYYKLNKLNVNYTDDSIEFIIYDSLDDMKKGVLKFKTHASSQLVFYKNDKSDSDYVYQIISQLLVRITKLNYSFISTFKSSLVF